MTLKPYVAPDLNIVSARERTLCFAVYSLALGTQQTIVQGPIPFKYRIKNIKLVGINLPVNLFDYYFLISTNPQGSTTGLPSGDSLFGNFGSIPHLNENSGPYDYDVPMLVEVLNVNTYIKMHVVNNAGFAVSVCAYVTIEEMA